MKNLNGDNINLMLFATAEYMEEIWVKTHAIMVRLEFNDGNEEARHKFNLIRAQITKLKEETAKRITEE